MRFRTVLVSIVVGIALGAVTSCRKLTSAEIEARKHGSVGVLSPQGDYVKEWVDSTTGCRYLLYGERAITPRLGDNGQPMCVRP